MEAQWAQAGSVSGLLVAAAQRGVVEVLVGVDPEVAFGLPVVTSGGARVEDLVDRFLAGDTLSDIAGDFDVPHDQLEDVIRVATRSAA